jgi:simple sugar transport system permease protein
MNASSIIATILISILRLSVPVIITGLGNMYSVRAGIMNLSAEGMMISGAFFAVLGTWLTGNPWIGVLSGILGGVVVAAVHTGICVEFGGNQNVSGLGLNTLMAGVTSFFCRSLFGSAFSPMVASIQTTGFLSGIPFLGGFLSQFSPIFYIMILILAGCWFVVEKTVIGLRMNAVGFNPQMVETAGVNVWRLKHASVLICGALVGLAGAYLSIGQLNNFMEGMTMGKGMLAVIAVQMGRQQPLRIVAFALGFSFFDAVQIQLQINSIGIPAQLIQTIPYVVGIATLAISSTSKAVAPRLLMPYLKNKYKI